ELMTLNGKSVVVELMDGHVYINGAKVTMADIEADNGVVHVINAVLIPPSNTVVDIIVNSADHTILETAVIEAELVDALSAEGPFTVFAPTDEAFGNLPEGTLETLLEDPTGELAQILLYHVAGVKALSNELSDGQEVMTLNGKTVTVELMDGHVYINGAKVTMADIEADNGVVHVINAVLLPPSNTVVDIIVNSVDHTILETAVIEAELVDALSAEGPFTVFAPTDEAFGNLPEGTLETLLEDPTGELAQILLYHVAGAKALSNELSDGQEMMTLNGKSVVVELMDGHVYINGAKVTMADIEADNGVVHVINAVLLPPTSAAEFIEGNPSLSMLENALKQTGLWELLEEIAPFTLFAPSNDAFENMDDENEQATLKSVNDNLEDILKYHLVSNIAFSDDLFDGQELTTLQGNTLRVNVESENVFINDARVTGSDNAFQNSVVHIIDAVLIPGEATNVLNVSSDDLKVFPNPAEDEIFIQAGNGFGTVANLKIYDLSGQLVKAFSELSVNRAVNVSDLSNGIYLFYITIDGQTFIDKVIVK
ncbi:MAG: fasciclin domain-containing protein, partial [Carboxylicivirga sp.]|nr:fasciclin domain-containing protein [Carboxylicivirga sp.]